MRDLFRFALVTMLSMLSPWIAADLPFRVVVFLSKGYLFHDPRDIPLHLMSFSDWTILYWTVAFSSLSCAAIFTIKWLLSRDSDVLYWLAGAAGIPCFFFYHSLLVIGKFTQ